MARTDTLGHFLTDVADAIRTKAGTSDTIQASTFDTAISNIPSGGGLDWTAIGYSSEPSIIEDGYDYAKDIYDNWDSSITVTTSKYTNNKVIMFFPKVDMSNVTIATQMFYNSGLVYAELDLPKTTNCQELFNGCNALRSAKLKTSSYLTNAKWLFTNCRSLLEVDMSEFNAFSVSSFLQMFKYCDNLKRIDMSNVEAPNLTNTSSMFEHCISLEFLDIRKLTLGNVTSYSLMFDMVPNDCEIIVKDDTQKTWITGKFSNLTNVKTVAEYEAE